MMGWVYFCFDVIKRVVIITAWPHILLCLFLIHLWKSIIKKILDLLLHMQIGLLCSTCSNIFPGHLSDERGILNYFGLYLKCHYWYCLYLVSFIWIFNPKLGTIKIWEYSFAIFRFGRLVFVTIEKSYRLHLRYLLPL